MISKIGKEAINTFSGGMNADLDKSIVKGNQYRYAENVRVSVDGDGTFGSISPIEDTELTIPNAFEGDEILHSVSSRDMAAVFTRNTSTGRSNIYRVIKDADSVAVKKVLSLSMNIGDHISALIRYEDDDNVKLYWADGENSIRSANIAVNTEIELINISQSNPTYFNIIPESNLNKPEIDSILSGSLLSGKIQYTYQLYSESGASTVMSPASDIIDILLDDNTGGGLSDVYGMPANKAVRLKIELPDVKFKGIKLYSIYYYNLSATPQITLVKDIELSNSDSFLYIIDSGASSLSEYTVDEFASLSSNFFKASHIEAKDNILFAANVSDSDYTVDYDTRAFQFKFNKAYTVPVNPEFSSYKIRTSLGKSSLIIDSPLLQLVGCAVLNIGKNGGQRTINLIEFGIHVSSVDVATGVIELSNELPSSVFPIGRYDYIRITDEYTEIRPGTHTTLIHSADMTSLSVLYEDIATIDSAHDCIHKEIYEKEKYSELEYTRDVSNFYGGSGVNVSYRFVNALLIGAAVGDRANQYGVYNTYDNMYIDQRKVKIGDRNRSISNIITRSSDGAIGSITFKAHTGRLDLSNPIVSSLVTGYKRDEIYRFAAVFRDKSGKKSKAKWIADIRFPAGYIDSGEYNASTFCSPVEVDSVLPDTNPEFDFINKQELIIKQMGVSFTFSNLDQIENLGSIEIVRAKRDINNRTIYSQGVLQKTGTLRKFMDDTYAADNKYYDTNGYGQLRPHPIVSMGYAYSIAAPFVFYKRDYPATLYGDVTPVPVNGVSYSAIHYNYYNYSTIVQERDIGKAGVSTSPYYANKNVLMFISPELSYYGVDFTEQLRHVVSSPKISVQNIVTPVSTPAYSDLEITSDNIEYVGRIGTKRMRMLEAEQIYPTAMYFAASLNEDLILADSTADGSLVGSDNIFYTLGLAGTTKGGILGSIGDFSGFMATLDGKYDVPFGPDAESSEPFNRCFVSGIGTLSQTEAGVPVYRNGFGNNANQRKIALDNNSSEQRSPNAPWSVWSKDNYKLLDNNFASMTFKYYVSWSKHNGAYGTSYANLVKQTGSGFDDIDIIGISKISDIPTFKINEFEYSGDIIDPVNHADISEYTTVGGSVISNWSKPFGYDNPISDTDLRSLYAMYNRSRISGPHGPGMFIHFKDSDVVPSIGSISRTKKKYADGSLSMKYSNLDNVCSAGLGTYIVDLKQMNSSIYGGNTLRDREFTEYISTGCVITPLGQIASSDVFGGDTYVSMFDYTATRASDQMAKDFIAHDDPKDSLNNVFLGQTVRVGIIVPIETQINTHVDNGGSFSKTGNFAIQKEVGVYGVAVSAGNPWTRAQSKKEFNYNSAYSSEAIALSFLSSVFDEEINNVYDHRILASEKKTNDERFDSWSMFKAANYIDVDSRYGEITRIKEFNGKLLFFQENAVGAVAVNDRSLITDASGAELSLGTGGVLQRYDYISNNVGLSKDTIDGLVDSSTGVYWYDKNRNTINRLSNSIEQISKTRGIQSIMNFSKDVLGNRLPFGVNAKYGEIIMSFASIQDSESSEYRYIVTNDDSLLIINDDDIIIT